MMPEDQKRGFEIHFKVFRETESLAYLVWPFLVSLESDLSTPLTECGLNDWTSLFTAPTNHFETLTRAKA